MDDIPHTLRVSPFAGGAARGPEAAVPPLLEASGLRYRYKTAAQPSLVEGSFRLHRGELAALLGPNGCGKSTLLALVAGALPMQGGSLRLDGAPVDPWSHAHYRSRVGVVLQEPTLDPRLSVLENLLITAGLYGELGRSARERAATALHWLGAEPLAARPVKTLSGGERRRADVARALMGNPDVLLLDEPTHGLDEASFRALWDRLQGLAKEQGQALLVATHRPDEAERCNTLWLVARGAVVRSTTPAALRAAQPGEVLRVDSTEPQRVVEHASALGAVVHLQGNIAHIEAPRCAELLPRLLERLAPGTVRSVVLRQPTLADAFAQLTGEALVASQMGAE